MFAQAGSYGDEMFPTDFQHPCGKCTLKNRTKTARTPHHPSKTMHLLHPPSKIAKIFVPIEWTRHPQHRPYSPRASWRLLAGSKGGPCRRSIPGHIQLLVVFAVAAVVLPTTRAAVAPAAAMFLLVTRFHPCRFRRCCLSSCHHYCCGCSLSLSLDSAIVLRSKGCVGAPLKISSNLLLLVPLSLLPLVLLPSFPSPELPVALSPYPSELLLLKTAPPQNNSSSEEGSANASVSPACRAPDLVTAGVTRTLPLYRCCLRRLLMVCGHRTGQGRGRDYRQHTCFNRQSPPPFTYSRRCRRRRCLPWRK